MSDTIESYAYLLFGILIILKITVFKSLQHIEMNVCSQRKYFLVWHVSVQEILGSLIVPQFVHRILLAYVLGKLKKDYMTDLLRRFHP